MNEKHTDTDLQENLSLFKKTEHFLWLTRQPTFDLEKCPREFQEQKFELNKC